MVHTKGMSAELALQATEAPKAVKMKTMADAPVLTLTKKQLAWIIIAVLTAVGGGQSAAQFVGGPAQADPRVDELARKVDSLGAEMEQMRADATARQRQHDRVLSAILVYQIESSRFARETRGSETVPLELQRAEARLVEIATGAP